MSFSLRQLLRALIAFGLIGSTSFQVARSAEYAAPVVMADMPCDMMMSHTGMQDGKYMPPCKGMTAACTKQMGCITDAALPTRAVNPDVARRFSSVDYWSA
jgi:hypothetical protein